MTITIAVLNQKGGVGKTTLAVNLAAAAHLDGQKTLLVDLDRQGSALDWGAQRREGSKLQGLGVVKVDKALRAPHFRELTDGRDVVILDGPPRLGEFIRAAAVLTDVVVMPIQPGAFDLWAASETIADLDHADEIRAEFGREKVRRLFVMNRVVKGTLFSVEAPKALEETGTLAKTVIHQRAAYVRTVAEGESVLTQRLDPHAVDEILALYREIFGKEAPAKPAPAKTKAPAKAKAPSTSRKKART
ncbi:MAG TPA: ParA family partition ATPase [Polyangium sp.]|nr:ParA family partition ATPase [Polyangium sp.]